MWFQDGARVGQKNTLTRVWGQTGSRPAAPRDLGFASAYLFGAACPSEGKAAALIMPISDSRDAEVGIASPAKMLCAVQDFFDPHREDHVRVRADPGAPRGDVAHSARAVVPTTLQKPTAAMSDTNRTVIFYSSLATWSLNAFSACRAATK